MILIKIGGGKDINLKYICEDIASLVLSGEQVVILHGANFVRDQLALKLGIPTQTITSPSGVSSVYTDKDAIDVFLMSYAGLMNKKITATLQGYGVNALGLSGVDGRLIEAKTKDAVYSVVGNKTKLITNNLTGKVTQVNAKLLKLLLDNSYVPVCTPPAVSLDNQIVNVDNDFVVAMLVRELKIKKVVMLFEAPGMLRDAGDEQSLIPHIKKEELDSYLKLAVGRMKKKLFGTIEAFKNGAESIYWGDGRVTKPIISALNGQGTVID